MSWGHDSVRLRCQSKLKLHLVQELSVQIDTFADGRHQTQSSLVDLVEVLKSRVLSRYETYFDLKSDKASIVRRIETHFLNLEVDGNRCC